MIRLVLQLLIVTISVAIMACSDSNTNPLIGEWKIDASKLPAGAQPTEEQLNQTLIEFTETNMISQGQVNAVTYEVLDGTVIVTGADGKGMKIGVKDRNHVVLPKTIISPEVHLVRK